MLQKHQIILSKSKNILNLGNKFLQRKVISRHQFQLLKQLTEQNTKSFQHYQKKARCSHKSFTIVQGFSQAYNVDPCPYAITICLENFNIEPIKLTVCVLGIWRTEQKSHKCGKRKGFQNQSASTKDHIEPISLTNNSDKTKQTPYLIYRT